VILEDLLLLVHYCHAVCALNEEFGPLRKVLPR
jgi:hypothetical protein